MTAFAILRTAKLKTAAQIIGAVGHNSRERETLNADSSRKNVVFRDIGSDPAAAVMNRIKMAGAQVRADSVLAVEILCSASPEYFRPGRESEAGVWDAARVEKWVGRTRGYLDRRYGDRLLDCRLHLDESTPHIQAIVVPLTRDNRLCAKEVIGPMALRQMQTGYAKELASLGIHRGLEGSKAKHSTIKEYYRDVNAGIALPRTPEPAPVPVPPLLLTQEKREAWAAEQTEARRAEAANQSARRAPGLRQIVRKARERDAAIQQAREARAEDARLDQIHQRRVTAMQQEMALVKAERDAAREEVYRLRGVRLEVVLEAAGLDRCPDGRWGDLGRSIKIEPSGKWFHHDAAGDLVASGKGAIDLVKHLEECDYNQALGWLRENCGSAAAEIAFVESVREQQAPKVVAAAPSPKPFVPPPPTQQDHPGWPAVKKWLTQVRGLKDVLVERLRSLGLIRVETRSPVARSMSDLAANGGQVGPIYNAVFMTQRLIGGLPGDPIGGEVRGTGKKFSGMLPGSNRKGGGFCLTIGNDSTAPVILVESALDAVAYAELHPKEPALIVSTGGATGKHAALADWKRQGRKLVIGYDRDDAGHAAAAGLAQQWESLEGTGPVVRAIPAGKDWNDDLRSPARKLAQTMRTLVVTPVPRAAAFDPDMSSEPAGPGM